MKGVGMLTEFAFECIAGRGDVGTRQKAVKSHHVRVAQLAHHCRLGIQLPEHELGRRRQ